MLANISQTAVSCFLMHCTFPPNSEWAKIPTVISTGKDKAARKSKQEGMAYVQMQRMLIHATVRATERADLYLFILKNYMCIYFGK